MNQEKVKAREAWKLLEDLYSRKQADGGIFFGVDTADHVTRLENLQSKQDGLTPGQERYYREKWERPFDIDFFLEFGAGAGQPKARVYHEVKGMERAMRTEAKESLQYGGKDAEGNYLYGKDNEGWELVTAHTRGMLPVELVGDLQLMDKHSGHLKEVDGKWVYTEAQEQADTVPGTNIVSLHIPGQGWGVKGTFQANYFHFYLPMMPDNEGRITTNAEELERMQARTAQGAKLITEAPAGLFITISKPVKDALFKLALQWLADHFNKVDGGTLSERREVLEEFKNGENVKAINVSVPASLLVTAWEQVYDTGRGALLEVRPVVKFVRNGTPGEEIEIMDNGGEYWIPERLQAVYFSRGALKRDIQGYWDDGPRKIVVKASGEVICGRRLLAFSFGFENRIRDCHVVGKGEDREGTENHV